MGPLMWVFIAEMLPREYKVLSGIVSSAGLFFVFAVTKTFPTLTTLTSPQVIYWTFSGVALASNFFYFFLLPETKGETPLEVKNMFLERRHLRPLICRAPC